jgi:polyisoprenoid-binding protein YceI
MKTKLLSILFIAGAFYLQSCGEKKDETKKEETSDAAEVTYIIDPIASKVEWTGNKEAYGHHGTISIMSGKVMVKGDVITGGSFEMDMSTIKEMDQPDTSQSAMLEGHLKDTAFFNVATYPKATFEITKGEKSGEGKYKITGNLTVKGITKEISFDADVKTDKVFWAEASFDINRTEFGIKFMSKALGAAADKMIKDEINFKVTLNGAPEMAAE